MADGLDATAWSGLFGATAAASAALLGLIFVAVSLHIREVERGPALRLRARVNLQALAALLMDALVGLIPGQPAAALGTELLVLAALYTWLVVAGSRRTSRQLGGLPRDVRFRLVVQNAAVLALQVAAGICLIVGAGPGLYLLAPTLVLGLPITTFNSWNIIFAPELHARAGQ